MIRSVLIFLVALGTGGILTLVMIRLAFRWGMVDHPGGRKGHGRAVPLGGGLALAAAFFLAPVLAGTGGWLPGGWQAGETGPGWAGGAWTGAEPWGAVGLAGVVILLVGLWDDHRPLSPSAKLAWQIGVAVFLVAAGMRASLFTASPLVGGGLTVLWLVMLMNSFNFLDNMDGLASGIALVSSLLFWAVAWLTGQAEVAGMLAALAGACLGFLLFNFPPARIFMGDAGSQFLGLMLGCATILFTFYRPGQSRTSVVLPILIFAVPLYDLLSIIFLRLRQGHPPWRADQNHFSHRLRALGLSPRQVALFLYFITLAVGLPSLLLLRVSGVYALVLFLNTCAVLLVIFILEQQGRKS